MRLTVGRKKFLKMKHTFKEKMGESNSLFDEEQRAMKLARRLQEQNEYWFSLNFCLRFILMEAVSYSTSFSTSTSQTAYLHIFATIFDHPLLTRSPSQRLSLIARLEGNTMRTPHIQFWKTWRPIV